MALTTKRGAAVAALACLLAVASCMSGGSRVPTPRPTATPTVAPPPSRTLPSRLYGVTLDDVTDLDGIVASLAHLPRKPVVRLVLDPGMSPADYRRAVERISSVAYLMAQPVDSSELSRYGLSEYVDRFRQYLGAFGGNVDVWEIGNEVNGDWTGSASDVRAKIVAAYDLVHEAGGRTALTLYDNLGCGGNSSDDLWTWAERYVPERLRVGLDYVLVSYYEKDCDNLRPSAAAWGGLFTRLRTMFPRARLGFGEVGAETDATIPAKIAYLNRYYRLSVAVPGYVGGYFWWYYAEEMVPYRGNRLWQALADDMN